MADVAALGLAVDSSQVSTGAKALDDLTKSAQGAATAAANLKEAASASGAATAAHAAAASAGAAATNAGTTASMGHANAMRTGAQATQNAAAALHGAAAAHSAHGAAAKFNTIQMMELAHVTRSVIEMMSMGVSPMRVLATEGSRISTFFTMGQGGVGGTLSAVAGVARTAATGFLGLAGAAGAAALAGTAAAISWSSAQDRLTRSLEGTGRASGMSLADINGAAAASAAAGRMSLGQARGLVGGFAQAGANAAVTTGLAGSVRRFSGFTGQDMDAAGKSLAEGVAAPGTKGIALLDSTFGMLNQRVVDTIKDLEAQGNRQGAQKAFMDSYLESLKATTDQTWTLTKAFQSVQAAAGTFVDYIGGKIAKVVMGPSLEDRQAEIRARMATLGAAPSTPAQARRQTIFGGSSAEAGALQRDLEDIQSGLAIKAATEAAKAAQARRDEASRTADPYVRSSNPDFEAQRGLENAVKALQAVGDSSEQAAKALSNFKRAQDNYAGEAQKVRESTEAAVRSTITRSDVERASIAANEKMKEALRATTDGAKEAAEAEGILARQRAEATRALRDAQRDVQDKSSMFGLRPSQQALRELEIQQRNRGERFSPEAGGASGTTPVPMPPTRATGALTHGAGLNEDFTARLRQLMDAVPGLSIGSGYRTHDEQARLYAQKPGLAAPPGHSNHEFGLAADLQFATPAARAQAHALAGDYGLRFPMGYEPWHIEPVGAREMRNGARPLSITPGSASPSAAAAGNLFSGVNRDERGNLIREQQFGVGSPLGQSQIDFEQQSKNLDMLRNSADHTTAGIAALAEKQKLLNEYWRAGTDITPDVAAVIDRQAAKYGQLAKAQEDYQKSIQVADFARSESTSLFSGLGRAIGDKKKPGEALREWAHQLGGNLIDKGAGMLTEGIFGKAGTPLGGLFGGLFGGGDKSTGSMNVNAAVVNVGGSGIAGLLGGGGGGGLLGAATGGGAPGGGGGNIFTRLLGGIFGMGSKGIYAPGGGAAYASGTDSAFGGQSLIDDKYGGEIVNLPQGSQVIPHDVSMAIARGGNGPNIRLGDVHIHPVGGAQFTPDQLAQIRGHVVAGQHETVQSITRNLGQISSDAQQQAA
jgi:hypothetical protein